MNQNLVLPEKRITNNKSLSKLGNDRDSVQDANIIRVFHLFWPREHTPTASGISRKKPFVSVGGFPRLR